MVEILRELSIHYRKTPKEIRNIGKIIKKKQKKKLPFKNVAKIDFIKNQDNYKQRKWVERKYLKKLVLQI